MLKNELNNYFRFNPESLTLISTLKCTSSCNSCCFGCTPKSQAMFNIDQMYSIVDKVYKNNKTIKQIVLSGGESFLLGESLLEFIKYAKKHGYLTRCITNGYWAKEKKSTKIIVNRLIHAGLDEINFSTGGEHQVFVPFEIVADAAKLTTESGLLTVISIEGGDIDFSLKEVSNHPSIKAIKRRNLLKLLQNVWVPFCGGKIQEEKELYQQKRKTNISGCENIFANLAITPDGSIYACCGLAVLNIPELRLGNIYEQNLPEILNSGFEDPLKAWLRIDGPEIIIQKLRDNGHSIINRYGNRHQCQACASIFLDKKNKKISSYSAHKEINSMLFKCLMRDAIGSRIRENWSRGTIDNVAC